MEYSFVFYKNCRIINIWSLVDFHTLNFLWYFPNISSTYGTSTVKSRIFCSLYRNCCTVYFYGIEILYPVTIREASSSKPAPSSLTHVTLPLRRHLVLCCSLADGFNSYLATETWYRLLLLLQSKVEVYWA